MASPIIVGAAASLATSIVASPYAAVLGGLTQAISREAGYEANRRRPNLIGPPEAILEAYLRGQISPGPFERILTLEEYQKLVAYHGVGLHDPHVGDGLAAASDLVWRETMTARRTRPSLDALLQMHARGFIADEARLKSLARWYIPHLPDFDEWRKTLCFTLSPPEVIHARQRQVFDDAARNLWLQRIGVISPTEQAYWREREKEIPGISDLIHFLVREAFDGAIVAGEKYMEGFPTDILEWAKRLGFGWDVPIPSWQANGLPQPTWAHLYWTSHWVRMSPTQSAEALHRNRPGRVAAQDVWTAGDHQRLLRINDYAPRDRRQLELISYRPLGRIDIRRAHYLGVFDTPGDPDGRKEVAERFQDAGFDAPTSIVQAETVIRDNLRRRYREQVGLTRQKIQQSYFAGIVDTNSAEQLLLTIGYSAQEATLAVAGWQLEYVMQRAKKLIAGIRRNYLLGDYDAAGASAALGKAGILPERVAEYLAIWDQEARQYRLEVAPQRLTDWLLYGVIDEPEMRRRLVNLGWANEDIDRMIRYAIARNQRRAPPALHVPKGKGGRAGMAKSSELSRSEIRSMYLEGIFTREEADTELGVLALDPTDRSLLLQLWDKQSGK